MNGGGGGGGGGGGTLNHLPFLSYSVKVCILITTLNVPLSGFIHFRVTPHSCILDLGFILDASGSIRRNGFNQEIKFVQDVTHHFRISGSHTRVSVMIFASNPSMKVYFRDRNAQSYSALNNALRRIRFTGRCLEKVREGG